MPTEPSFIIRDAASEQAALKSYYEGLTNKVLQPSQVESLIFDAVAYQIYLAKEGIQKVGLMNLPAFSEAPFLDYLAEYQGVIRLDEQPATCQLQFVFSSNTNGLVIPDELRVASVDGRIVFKTIQQTTVPAGVLTYTVDAQAITPGIAANGFAPGTITNLLDALVYVTSVTNINTTAGGSNIETDEQLRERVRLAPDRFSVAGPDGAYIFWAKTASPLIIDVAVTSTIPGQVDIYPLMDDGSVTPSQILTAVFNSVNPKNRRPLTDKPVVTAPTRINYTLVCDVTIYDTADAATVQAEIENQLAAFALARRQKLGRDITLDQLKRTAVYDRNLVYSADFGAFADIVVAENEFAYCTSITVNIIASIVG